MGESNKARAVPPPNGFIPDISIIGELNPDVILYGVPNDLPEEREVLSTGFTLTLGSSSAILAHNLSLLGSQVSFTACVGDDVFGEMCCRTLQEAGADLTHIAYAPPGVNTGVTVILPLTGTRRIITYPGAMFELRMEHIDIEYLAAAKHFHLSSLFLHRGLSPDIPRLFSEMKQRGLSTSLDTNDDPEGQWGGVLDEVLQSTDILFCTERELLSIARVSQPDEAAEALAQRLPLLVVKRGIRGASAYKAGRRLDAASLRVEATDSIGAGDSFDAGFLHQFIRGAPLETCLAFANVAGALSVTRSGGTAAFKDTAHRTEFLAQHWNRPGL